MFLEAFCYVLEVFCYVFVGLLPCFEGHLLFFFRSFAMLDAAVRSHSV